jgi:hypothetical protein
MAYLLQAAAMQIETILGQLQKVKKGHNPNTWQACCPAHDDKSPSLSLRQLDDGRVLLHCFGGCSVGEVLAALGLKIEDLFPDRLGNFGKVPAPFPARDVLQALARESLIVAMAASELTERPLSAVDRDRLFLAHTRITEAIKLAGLNHVN